MKGFFKMLLAVVVGCFVAFGLIIFVVFGIAGSAMSKKPEPVAPNTVLRLNLAGEITDRAVTPNPMGSLPSSGLSLNMETLGLNDILKAIARAKDDANISGIYIEQSGFGGGMATLEEVRNALIDFKQSGKFIVSHSDMYTQKSYYMASVADRVYLTPEGGLSWAGLGGSVMFYTRALEKLGVEPQVIRHGKFKSAVEPFMLDKMSPENREQTLTYLGSMWKHWLHGVSKERGIDVERLNQLADDMSIVSTQDAVDHGFIDALLYKDQIIDTLKALTGTPTDKELKTIGLQKYVKTLTPSGVPNKNKVAVIYAQGEIGMGKNSDGASIGSESLSKTIREARRDSTIKAIVLRINSPGGSALASEVIWREVQLANAVKPVVVSMGDVAASGGYYIAAPASAIVASPTTITGSIGVFGLLMNGKKAMDKLGLSVDEVGTNRHANMGSMHRPLTNEERAVVQKGVEDVYATFIGHVAQGRGLSTERVDEIGQGRVWSGANAMDIRLIDRFGGLNEAIAMAAEHAGLEGYRLVEMPKLKSPFEQMMELFDKKAKLPLNGPLGDLYAKLLYLSKNQGVQALMPYSVEIR